MAEVYQIIGGFINEIGLPVAVIVILVWFLRRLLSMWEKQQASWDAQSKSWDDQLKSRDEFQEKLLERYSTLDKSTDELIKQFIVFQTATEQFVQQVATSLQSLNKTYVDWKEINQQAMVVTQEAQAQQVTQITALQKDVQVMGKQLGQNDQENGERLERLTDELAVLSKRLESIDELVELLKSARLERFAEASDSIVELASEIKLAVQRINSPNTANDEESTA